MNIFKKQKDAPESQEQAQSMKEIHASSPAPDAAAVIGGLNWYRTQFRRAMKLALALTVALCASLGVAAILLAMEKLHAVKDKLKCNVAVLISTQEEVTELGAQTGAFTVQPEYAIAVDVTHGRTPDGPSDGVFDLGSGVAVGMGPNLHRGFTKALIKTAKANDIDYTLEIMEGNTGTNAWTMQIVGRGIAMGLLSIPEKYMHTPVEVVELSDVQAVADLMAEFLREFDGEVGA